jgi:hypothetical protein
MGLHIFSRCAGPAGLTELEDSDKLCFVALHSSSPFKFPLYAPDKLHAATQFALHGLFVVLA